MADTFIEELADKLVTESVVSLKGDGGDVFFDHMPEDDFGVDTPTVCLYDIPGPEGELYSEARTVLVKYRIRGLNVTSCRGKANQIKAALHAKTDVQLEDHRIISGIEVIRAQSIGTDRKHRSLMQGTMQFRIVAQT